MKRYLAGICLIFVTTGKSFAGGDEPPQWNISTTPQYIFNDALKMDIERKIGPKDWIGLSAEYYYGPIYQDSTAYGPNSTLYRYHTPHQGDFIHGAGITLDIKEFVSPRYFLAFGLNYARLTIDYQDNAWVKSEQYGITYYNFTLANGKLQIDRYDGFFGFGYSSKPASGFHVDFFLGGGYRVINSNSSLGNGYRDYSRTIFDFQFQGIHPIFTMALGYMF
jgi:hypothetical protein